MGNIRIDAEDLSISPSPEKVRSDTDRKRRKPAAFIATFIIMAGFWILFSGRFDVFHLALGAVSCLLVAAISSDLLFPADIKPNSIRCWLRFGAYIPWILGQILRANLHVLYLVFHPRMLTLINPHLIQFDSRLQGNISRTTFANSITLTPGTITVSVSARGKFTVHCIDTPSGSALPGRMELKVAKVFDE